MARPRTFVKLNENGDILGAVRADVIPEEYDSPWVAAEEGEKIVEVEEDEETRELRIDVLPRRFTVDPDRLKLIER
jgi:hypothetical protein